jgi:hypothetical protein
MAAVRIVCLLGRVASPDEYVEIVNDDSLTPNSSRWMFDVEHDTNAEENFDLQLLSWRSGRPKEEGLVSITITPLCRDAARACVRVPEPDAPKLTFEADKVGKIYYRVTLNFVHSLTA